MTTCSVHMLDSRKPGSFIRGIFQARSGLLFPSPEDFQPRDQTYFDKFDPSPALAGMSFLLSLLVFTAAHWPSSVAASGVVVQGLLTGVAFCRAQTLGE